MWLHSLSRLGTGLNLPFRAIKHGDGSAVETQTWAPPRNTDPVYEMSEMDFVPATSHHRTLRECCPPPSLMLVTKERYSATPPMCSAHMTASSCEISLPDLDYSVWMDG